MRHIDITGLDFLDVEIIVNTVRYESITKAAQCLFLSQSLISKRISLFEQNTGLQLFIRQNRKIQVTPAGRELARQLEQIHSQMLAALEHAHDIQMGNRGILRLGSIAWNNASFISTIESFHKKIPNISLSFKAYDNYLDQRTELLQGNLDVIFTTTYDYQNFSSEFYKNFVVDTVPLVAVINVDNPLSDCQSLSFHDLKQQSFLMLEREQSPSYYESIFKKCHEAGFTPNISHYSNSCLSHIYNVMLNQGILIASACFITEGWNPKIRVIPIENTRVNLTAVYPAETENPCILRFIKYLRDGQED